MTSTAGPKPIALLLIVLVAGCAMHADPSPTSTTIGGGASEAARGTRAKAAVLAQRQMVVAAHPLAAEAGRAMLRAGGSAVDAAIATQLVLNLVEPQSSGIGGGGFLLHYDARDGDIAAYDGRETAPAAATTDLFLGPDREPLEFFEAAVGGRAVGVPGLLRMLALAHERHGRLPWQRLFEPAIGLAERGFPVSPRLHALIAADEHLGRLPGAASYFHRPDGMPRQVGERLRNPEFASTLRIVATDGAEAFYRGPIAADIVAAVRQAPGNRGGLNLTDMAGYRAETREALCRTYRSWQVCSMPPPTSGGVAVLQILGLIEGYEIGELAPASAEAAHLFAEASRLAFADRDRYLADPAFVSVPVEALLAEDYLRRRGALISPDRAAGPAKPGLEDREFAWATPPASPEPVSTSHISVVDADGNAVSFTTSIESAFGARLMVRGFLLNNELTDFAFEPTAGDRPVANRVEPGKRPRSSMAPLLVFDRQGRLAFVIGSPGGPQIIDYVAKALLGVLDWRLDMQTAVALPNLANRNGATELEAGTALEAIAPALAALGHEIKLRDLNSGLHGIAVTPEGLVGGADPRREGVALGD